MKIISMMMLTILTFWAQAQETLVFEKASLTILVKDPDNQPLPGAVATLVNDRGTFKRTFTTNERGNARFIGLIPGVYELQVRMTGFNTYIMPEIRLEPKQNGRLAVTLDVSSVTEEMVVARQSYLRDRTVLTQKEMNQSPVASDPWASMAVNPTLSGLSTDRIHIESRDEAYIKITPNQFSTVEDRPLSTFSIDVDTAAYSNIRRYIRSNQNPPVDAVRIEEMINYFSYDDPQPEGKDPISARMEVGPAPWNPEHRLVRIGVKAREIDPGSRPTCNLVFLIDVSGSMSGPYGLDFIKESLLMLADNLTSKDRVSIVVYAGASGLALDTVRGDDYQAIADALVDLYPRGGTNGSEGIELAYDMAQKNFFKDGSNRVILATDGDFNMGVTGHKKLMELIKKKAESGVFLTALGFGMTKDKTIEQLANKGNGQYAYIDSIEEAEKSMVDEIGASLVTVAKDVKLQVEFNPAVVGSYRLIGYENRLLADEEFNDDTVDAGEMGAGHSISALYEIIPRHIDHNPTKIDPLKYQEAPTLSTQASQGEMLTLKIRYKEPDRKKSRLLAFPLVDQMKGLNATSDDFRFASAVAAFGMILRESSDVGKFDMDDVIELATPAIGYDPYGYRAGLIDLIEQAGKFIDIR